MQLLKLKFLVGKDVLCLHIATSTLSSIALNVISEAVITAVAIERRWQQEETMRLGSPILKNGQVGRG